MFYRVVQILSILLVAGCGCIVVSAQSSDPGNPLVDKQNEREPSYGIKEMLDKMRIEKDKKDHEEMIARGQDILDLSDDLEKKIEKDQTLSAKDLEKLETVEKLAKKIRSELGGGDDLESDEKEKDQKPSTLIDGIKVLRTETAKLLDELKKTTRFSISAAAIQSSNAVLRTARLLRFWR